MSFDLYKEQKWISVDPTKFLTNWNGKLISSLMFILNRLSSNHFEEDKHQLHSWMLLFIYIRMANEPNLPRNFGHEWNNFRIILLIPYCSQFLFYIIPGFKWEHWFHLPLYFIHFKNTAKNWRDFRFRRVFYSSWLNLNCRDQVKIITSFYPRKTKITKSNQHFISFFGYSWHKLANRFVFCYFINGFI